MELLRIRLEATGRDPGEYEFARAKLAAFSPEELQPPRLLTGDDLIALGRAPGPEFGRLLEAVETEQLEGRITTRDAALQFVAAW